MFESRLRHACAIMVHRISLYWLAIVNFFSFSALEMRSDVSVPKKQYWVVTLLKLVLLWLGSNFFFASKIQSTLERLVASLARARTLSRNISSAFKVSLGVI